MTFSICRAVLPLVGLLVAPLAGQTVDARLDAIDHAERMQRIEQTGDLGLPPLPPITAGSPRDSLLSADRFPVGQGSYEAGGDPGVLVSVTLPPGPGPGQTGTDKSEVFKYQLGSRYNPLGPPHPLVVAYHGYGASANSPSSQSTIDEECNARSMVYMSPTGIDDQLFGSPISQQNVEAAMQYMLDNFNIDEDRIYMVGFSMGAGIVANFAARRRDPDGIMIAALGLLSGSFDWTQLYNTGGPATAFILDNPYNFGGPPTSFPFRYQQASVLYFEPGTYPPLPGVYVPQLSMGTNLRSTPVYMTWDDGDTIEYVATQNPVLETELLSQGGTVVKTVVSGTIDPNTGNPAPHSWAVLDEEALLDFFAGKVVDRTPDDFAAQSDLGGPISWVDATQRTLDAFTWIDGLADDGTSALSVTAVENATDIVIDAAEAGLTGSGPFALDVASVDADGFDLRLEGFAAEPSYVRDDTTGLLVPGVASDPLAGALSVPIPGLSTLDATIVSDPDWTTDLLSTPNPVAPGATATIDIDAPVTSTETWWILGFSELFTPLQGGFEITVSVVGPSFFTKLLLDANGDLSFPLDIPDDPTLSGAFLYMQCLTNDVTGDFDSVSNLWILDIE